MSVVSLKPSPVEKKRSFTSGIYLATACCIAYYSYDYIKFTFFPEVTLRTEVLTPIDINYVPFTSGYTLPLSQIKVHSFNNQGMRESETKNLKDFVGKPMILHMWATWCPPCVHEMPIYNQYATQTKDKIQNLAIMSGQAVVEDIQSFFKQKSIDQFPIMTDESSSILSTFQINSLPASIFINAKGKPLGYIIGPVSWDSQDVQDLIARILEGQ